jgi:hypothetical protein
MWAQREGFSRNALRFSIGFDRCEKQRSLQQSQAHSFAELFHQFRYGDLVVDGAAVSASRRGAANYHVRRAGLLFRTGLAEIGFSNLCLPRIK